MYGTVARFRTLPGKEKDLIDLGERMAKDPAKGQVGEYVFKLDSGNGEYMIVVLFNDRESYHSYAQSPESDRNYRMIRELLAADPEWNDGEVVQEFHHQ